MEKFVERPLPLRGVLRMQAKGQEALEYIKGTAPVWEDAAKNGKLIGATVFALEDQIFVYYESKEEFKLLEYLPNIGEFVFMWPGNDELRPYIPMFKFYQSVPMETIEDWNDFKDDKPMLMISRMNMEKLQSYIYYHYQMQEELPGHNGRYCAIWGSEDWCVLYQKENHELPIPVSYEGALKTKDCPVDEWGQYMGPHFYAWPEGEYYRYGDIVLTVSAPGTKELAAEEAPIVEESPAYFDEPVAAAFTCVNCGVVLAEGQRFCTNCGTPVAAPVVEEAPVVVEEIPAVPTCVNCGAVLAEGQKFCTNCGTPVAAPVVEEAPVVEKIPAVPTCVNCGAVLAEGQRFCTNCGTPVAAPVVEEAAPPVPQLDPVCANCGAILAEGQRFCTNCGTPVN